MRSDLLVALPWRLLMAQAGKTMEESRELLDALVASSLPKGVRFNEALLLQARASRPIEAPRGAHGARVASRQSRDPVVLSGDLRLSRDVDSLT